MNWVEKYLFILYHIVKWFQYLYSKEGFRILKKLFAIISIVLLIIGQTLILPKFDILIVEEDDLIELHFEKSIKEV